MKFLIVGDLHGHMPKIRFKNFDYIIAPGDFCGDKYEKPLIIKWIMSEGKKPREEKADYLDFAKKVLKISKADLKNRAEKSLRDGRKILKYLNSFGKPVLLVPGNWDQSFQGGKEIMGGEKDIVKNYKKIYYSYSSRHTNRKLTKGLKNLYDCQLKLFEFEDFNIVGYGLSSFPELPKKSTVKNKKKYAILKKEYGKLFNLLKEEYFKRNKKKPTIFLTHNVPYLSLDKIVAPGSPVHGQHYGSKIAAEFCKKYKPLVCVGSHIHEGFGKAKIGKTPVVNAGFGSNVNILMEIKGKRVTFKFKK